MYIYINKKKVIRYSIRIVLGICVLLAVLYLIRLELRDDHSDYNAPRHTARLIMDHLEKYDYQWPTSWDDLRAAHERINRMENPEGFFEEIQQKVVVNWEIDTAEFVAMWEDALPETPPATAVRLRRLEPTDPDAVEPDHWIYSFLTGGTSETGWGEVIP